MELKDKEQDLLNKLNESEAQKKAIADGFQGILIFLDYDLKVKWANNATLRNYPDALGRQCHEIFCRKNDFCKTCSIKMSFESGAVETSTQKIVGLQKTDEEIVFDIIGSPVKDRDGNITGVIGIAQNVTEQYSLERQLRHSQKMEAIGTLAGGVAHDFNNILTPIMGYTEIIRLKENQEGGIDPVIDNYLEEILKAAKRAKSLVDQVLTFSRTNEKRATLQYMHPIVKEVMKLLKVTIPSTVNIKEEIDEQCGRILIDPVQIHQVLINLCTNASDAMERRHGVLTVKLGKAASTKDGKNWVELNVSDTGEGISKENLERIFDPYFTTKEKTRGTGMGLAMVHGIVNNQGGYLEVESSQQKGTTFKLFFPVAETDTRKEQVVVRADLPRGEGNILLVDDDNQVLQVTGELLKSLGYIITGTSSPAEALEIFTRAPGFFDLVMTDLTMPELTGLELSEKLTAMQPDIRIILITGYSDTVAKADAKAAGISDYCVKPISIRKLADIVNKVLRKPGIDPSPLIH